MAEEPPTPDVSAAPNNLVSPTADDTGETSYYGYTKAMLAAELNGDGTEANPYKIDEVHDLFLLNAAETFRTAEKATYYYQQTADIDLSNSRAEWDAFYASQKDYFQNAFNADVSTLSFSSYVSPNDKVHFASVYDGNNKKLLNGQTALFSGVDGGVFKNLTFEGANQYYSVINSWDGNGVVLENVDLVDCTFTGGRGYIGCVAYGSSYGSITAIDCDVTGTSITGVGNALVFTSKVYGPAVFKNCTIANTELIVTPSTSTSNVSYSASGLTGALTDSNKNVVENCTSAANITFNLDNNANVGSIIAGGLISQAGCAYTITDSSFTGSIAINGKPSASKAYVGGLIGSIVKANLSTAITFSGSSAASATLPEADPETHLYVGTVTGLLSSGLTDQLLPSSVDGFGYASLVNLGAGFTGSFSINNATSVLYKSSDVKAVIGSHGTQVLTVLDEGSNNKYLFSMDDCTFENENLYHLSTLPVPVKQDAIFDGWYTNNAFTGSMATAPATGQTYYAKWIDLSMDDLSLQYTTSQALPTVAGVSLSGWASSDPAVASVSGNMVKATGLGTATLTANATTVNGGRATVSVEVEVTPLLITYGPTTASEASGNPYLEYPQQADGKAPSINDFMTFYPALKQPNGTFTADTASDAVTLVVGDDFKYHYTQNGNTVTINSLPFLKTEGNDAIDVDLIMESPNYRFVGVGTQWAPSSTLLLRVRVVAEGFERVPLMRDGQLLANFTESASLEYTGLGMAPTYDLTGISARGVSEFVVHFHSVVDEVTYDAHVSGPASALTETAVRGQAPKELGVYSFVVNGQSDAAKTYCYVSRRYEIVKGTPTGTPVVHYATAEGMALADVSLTGKMVNAASLEVPGAFTWDNPSQVAELGEAYSWTFTPEDLEHYKVVTGYAVAFPKAPVIVKGADTQVWEPGSNTGLSFTSDADFDDFVEVRVDGTTIVRDRDYTVTRGSTIVTLTPTFLATLSEGQHAIAIVSRTGAAETTFAVREAAAENPGGDKPNEGGIIPIDTPNNKPGNTPTSTPSNTPGNTIKPLGTSDNNGTDGASAFVPTGDSNSLTSLGLLLLVSLLIMGASQVRRFRSAHFTGRHARR